MSYSSFTITQPFLGAPLQFTPALGSDEFELLIDCYVTGAASKQDKLSQVTIDFYNTATVDLNTGSLTKTYNVFPVWNGQSFEQSPTESQSSGFSPVIYTPSPGSSATLGDSAYGSFMTPPTRTSSSTANGRVAKKTKKDTKKTAEARLPGFSIMTKDGIDVTSSAGRGTKTKEQREHAHLMRQLKACADCKRKKVRCDPAHRRAHNDMSRTSTSNASSSSRISPAASTPSTQGAISFNATNAFDDFILFPDDDMASWNPADLPMTDFASQDLSQFNFDINELDMDVFASVDVDMDFGFASHRQQSYSSPRQSPFTLPQPQIPSHPQDLQLDANIPGYAPFLSDLGLDTWTEPQGYSMGGIAHTRPHPTSPLNSGQLDDSWRIADPLQVGVSGSGVEDVRGVQALNARSIPAGSPRTDIPQNVPLNDVQSVSSVVAGGLPVDQVQDGHTVHASLTASRTVLSSTLLATDPAYHENVARVTVQPQHVRLDDRLNVNVDTNIEVDVHVQSRRNTPTGSAQFSQVRNLSVTEVQPVNAQGLTPVRDTVQAQYTDQQSILCLNRQDQPQDSEQGPTAPVFTVANASRNANTGTVLPSEAASSMMIAVLNTVLLSGLALIVFSGPLAWVREACLQSVGNDDTWMAVLKLALVGTLFVGLAPGLFSTVQSHGLGSGIGLGHVASAVLAFLFGSTSVSSGWASISNPTMATPSPSKPWMSSSSTSSQNFLLGLLEHLTPVAVGMV